MGSTWAPISPTASLQRSTDPAVRPPSVGRPMATDPVTTARRGTTSARLRVLVAEDNATLSRLSMRLVARLGHDVETVSTGAEAVGEVMTGQYDVVLMDIRMPVMDGLEAARRIRSVGSAIRQPRIVAITASATLRDQEKYLAAGMDDYVSKPFSGEDLQRAFVAAELAVTDAPEPAAPVRSRFSRLNELGPDAKRVILETLVARGAEDLSALDRALAARDAVQLRFLAHRLRGSGLAIGADALADAGLRLETAEGSDAVDGALVGTVRSAYEQSVRDIELELHGCPH